MNLSYKILSVLGVDIELHLLFILFILAFVLIDPAIALLLILIFFFVTLHELTHSVVAIRNGIKVRKIVLLPIGGMAMVESADIKPVTEIKMSIAGPLMNITIVLICLALAYSFSLPLDTWLSDFFDPTTAFNLPVSHLILFYSFYANLVLGLFNLLLPAFPLDGGRIFRALLALRMDYVKASTIAKNLSLVIASLMFFIAFLYGELWIMIISFFIGFGAVAEYNAMLVHRALGRVSIKRLLTKDFIKVKPSESIRTVLEKMLKKRKMDAIVIDAKGAGVVSLNVIAGLSNQDLDKKVGSIIKRIGRVSLDSGLENVARWMENEQVTTVPVFDGKKLVGVVERAEIERAIRILEILDRFN